MKRSLRGLDRRESEVLITLYEQPEFEHTTYTLTQAANPAFRPGSPEYGKLFKELCDIVEELIVCDLIQWKRQLRGADGIYFSGLKPTREGVKKAIQERRSIALPIKAAALMEVVEIIRAREEAEDERRSG